MRPVSEWDIAYILGLPQGEHDWVEFKGSRLLDTSLPDVDANKVLAELSKQLSAFANAGGGTLVYGITEDANGRRVDLGGVSLSIRNGTKEWLEDVVPRLVEFELTGFNIYTLCDPERGTGPGKGVIVVDIPDSEAAPHQAQDKKYYVRVSGKSRPIGHRMVLDIIGRRRHPMVALAFRICSGYGGLRELWVRCVNDGSVLAQYVNGWVSVPRGLAVVDPDLAGGDHGESDMFHFANTIEDVVGFSSAGMGRTPLTVTRYDPLLPGLGFGRKLAVVAKQKEAMRNFAEQEITWRVHADNAPARTGKLLIADLQWEEPVGRRR